jgi:hypothetical protein
MNAIRDQFAGFDLGEFLGLGLDTRQIGYLAGSLFLIAFGVLALRRVGRVGGPWPALWMAASVGLIAGGAILAGRGFPEQIPDELRPWTEPDRATRAAVVLALLGCSLVFLSAHWLRGRCSRTMCRAAGLGCIGLAIWLAAGWFADQLPDEARPWTARTAVSRGLVVAGFVVLAGALWGRPADEAAHRRWANRTLVGPALATAVILATRWFGPAVDPELPLGEIKRIAVLAAAIATGTCLLIACGAFLIRRRDRPKRRKKPLRRVDLVDRPLPMSNPLPVAVLLDEHGRPLLPPSTDQRN